LAILVKTVDPGVRGIRKAVKKYVKRYPDLSAPIEMYGAIMEVQQRALDGITCGADMDDRDVEERLLGLSTLIDPLRLEIDPGRFRELVGEVSRVVAEHGPGGFQHRDDLLSWDGLDEEHLQDTRSRVVRGEPLEIGEKWLVESDASIASSILWEALAPFYMKCADGYQPRIDQSLWQRGVCPVCGSRPLIGQFRPDDGLWVLECSLCHAWWNVQRASCPFCDGSGGGLDYLYVEEDPKRRVQYCEECRQYVKTVDLRDGEQDVFLPLEDLVTVRLDLTAKKEGLTAVS